MFIINKNNNYAKSICLIVTLFISHHSLSHANNDIGHSFNVPPGLLIEFEKLIEENRIPGAAIGLIEKGEQQFIGLGSISYTDTTAPDADTRYEIGSITKVFTALLAQTLVDNGQLSWSDSLGDHIDGQFRSAEVSQIQLKELAIHRSGLPRLPQKRSIFRDDSDPYDGYTRDHLYAELRSKRVGNLWNRIFSQPMLDKSYTYSNLGAGLLGQIAADQLHTDFETALTDTVLKPLAMQCSNLNNTPPLAPGHAGNKVVSNWHFQSLAGAGGLRSCMRDMLKFAAATLDAFENGRQDKNEDEQLTRSIAATLKLQTHDPYMGLGWLISRSEGQNIWWHNGGTGGYTSILLIEPETARALILLVNANLYKEVSKIGMNAMRAW